MTETRKSSEVYGGSLGLQTTVNIGFKLLKPRYGVLALLSLVNGYLAPTSDGKLWGTRYELQKVSPLGWRQLTHCL